MIGLAQVGFAVQHGAGCGGRLSTHTPFGVTHTWLGDSNGASKLVFRRVCHRCSSRVHSAPHTNTHMAVPPDVICLLGMITRAARYS
jgi:hypothetical protein